MSTFDLRCMEKNDRRVHPRAGEVVPQEQDRRMNGRNLDHRIDDAWVEAPRGVSRFEVERENIRLRKEAEGVRFAVEIMARAFAINAAATHEARMSGFSPDTRIYRTADAYARYILTGAHPE